MHYLALCTDDSYFASVVPHLFEGHQVQVVPTHQLVSVLHLSVPCSHCIIGLPELTEEDWKVLELVKTSSVTTFLMVRREITKKELTRAQNLGIAGVLIDPLVELQKNQEQNIEHVFAALTYQFNDEPPTDDTVYIGYDTYFHIEQHWISYMGTKTQLSDREAGILKLFLRYEGKILTKEIIADELWGGLVASGGIPKLVGRLRYKLGHAGTLINGRKQGGYIYEKGQPIEAS
jgi:two-component system, OmpR family, response regulator